MGLVTRLWRGEHDLKDTFWRFAVLIALAVNVVTSIAFMGLVAAEMPLVAFLVGYGLSVPYNIFAGVAVWRSADAHQGLRTTAETLRIAAIVWLAFLTFT